MEIQTTLSEVKTTFRRVKTTISEVQTTLGEVKTTISEVQTTFSPVKTTITTEPDLSFFRKGEGEGGAVEGVTMPDTAPRHMLVWDLACKEFKLDLSSSLTNA